METRGIVLWEQTYKEHSRILRVYTEDAGKITILAQGVMKRGAKKLPLTRPFMLHRYELADGKTFFYLKDGEVLKSYTFNQNYTMSLAGYFFMELVDRATEERTADARIFHLLDEAYEAIAKASPKSVMIAFGMRLLRLMGFSPSVAACVACGNQRIRELHYSVEAGGILCEKCGEHAMTFTKEEYRAFFRLHTQSLTSLVDLGHVSDQKFLQILTLSLREYLGIENLSTLTLLKGEHFF